ncbi:MULTISPECIES: EAL domain-containing protein [unclassified Novosphingobium]|uniref:putative bifunctional diguanylate cyclase/phosphodiesterase n=1 Tax=unclassified Novosphingobium TaxID=2644732 RepID=UPI00146E4F75|nr:MULTISPECIES: EAL domain-containing protein [unclassified Novosphingobium]NMN05320.1 diguanylate cyclase (GGDEF)-like protein [Novosphingobium sp. SG919]NMN87615.1 diguanylate cyclase (GGDEF)-like protein [Novosphingobium sp. SG916]
MSDFQSIILEMIARGAPLCATIVRLCEEVESQAPGVVCSVLTVDSGGRLRPLAAPSLPASLRAAIDGVAIGPNVGACGTATALGVEVMSTDIANDPAWAQFRDLMLPLGLRACWSRPIFAGQERPVGAFAFYYREMRGPSALERDLVDRCIALCAIALDRQRRVEERDRRANTDALTGLANRAAFNTALAGLDCSRPGNWALFMIDLDGFKAINDTYGHQAGDALLVEVGQRLAGAALPDPVYRIGGDEFAVLITADHHLQAIETLAERILETLRPPVRLSGHFLRPGGTMGMAIFSAGDCTPERVQQNADYALYHAKDIARGGFVRYWPGIGTRMTRRITAVRELDAALRDGRLEAHYQPIIHLASGEVCGLEALCRIRMDQRMVTAAEFHEATSDPQTACALTLEMIDQVARDARSWLDQGVPFCRVGINVSSADLHSAGFFNALAGAFERQRVPLSMVILEVTEAVYIDDDNGVIRRSVAALRAKGLKVALDDFGTGFASLTHLMSIPVDFIKIDKSFVDRIVSDRPSQIIVEGVIDIAVKLGIQVVAEGIEHQDQADTLGAMGCLAGQGYLFSRAVPGEAITGLICPTRNLGGAAQRAQNA